MFPAAAPDQSLAFLLVTAGAVFCATWAATGLSLRVLRRRRIMDVPNDRSSHDVPTPRGGGVGLVAVLCVAWIVALLSGGVSASALPDPMLLAGFAGLACLSLVDDIRGLGPAVRLTGHALAVAVALPAVTAGGAVFQGILPAWLDMTLTWMIWTGFLNFYNFMDGIDGITGVETAGIGIGLALLGTLASVDVALPLAGCALAAAALGFLLWNWAPARLFMGDVGSVPLGFLIGGLLIGLAASGHWVPALILPAYYLCDAGITIVRRTMRGEKIWQAHRQHFYQRANKRGRGHDAISIRIAAANLFLVAIAVAAASFPVSPTHTALSLAAAALVVFILLRWMAK